MNADPGLDPIRVLLVDDHPLVRDGVRMRLEATPHIRVAAEAGGVQEALELAAAVAPDIVLTDIRMPDGSGIELAAAFRERFPLVRVMVLSMHQDAEYVRRAVGLGVRGYVLKDAPAGQLVQAIEAVRAGGRHFSEGVRALVDGGQPVPPQARSLTPREAAVLRLLAEGRSNKDIAERMGTSVRTVETHRLHLRRKLRIDGQAALVKYAVAYADLPT
ncbi:two component transcriptional regulator, LuxR family [Paracidovorax avenae ATCC 19860]|uniref:Two component transcriptional regulator, LuxR family n=1 Tax=Paracidovorax avenae (strain ATCC 19860 / DSM 7227 / CCUG 15838 / JCM 20985 / LMG 2117 / NCPPB 1011) TaxID=643561 RepID=F0QC53_PARA1|nr:response regulator transcription factor [Paracidovorax avenae]ADX45040.1 two component transcriptional regulator, LuxR family [Paracidovorax avenae ATCC 19860]